jgi:hypothetical protein
MAGFGGADPRIPLLVNLSPRWQPAQPTWADRTGPPTYCPGDAGSTVRVGGCRVSSQAATRYSVRDSREVLMRCSRPAP